MTIRERCQSARAAVACAFVAAVCVVATTTRAAGPDCCTLEDVTYRNGEIALAAELVLPKERAGPVPAAVILQGSRGGRGATRNNGWAAGIADLVAARGVAVLLTDKRGAGLSGGDWRVASYGDLAGDALAGVRYLRGRTDIDGSRIGLIGLSQGGRIAPLAASLGDGIAFVANLSGGLTSTRDSLYHELHNTYRQLGHDEEAIDELQELTRMSYLYLDTGRHFDRYLVVRSRIQAKYGAMYVETWPDSPGADYWTRERSRKDYDPLPHWQQVVKGRRIPCLVAHGELDEQDNVEVVRSRQRARRQLGDPLFLLRVYPGTGHGLWEPGREPGELKYHRQFRLDLETWIDQVVAAPEQARPPDTAASGS